MNALETNKEFAARLVGGAMGGHRYFQINSGSWHRLPTNLSAGEMEQFLLALSHSGFLKVSNVGPDGESIWKFYPPGGWELVE